MTWVVKITMLQTVMTLISFRCLIFQRCKRIAKVFVNTDEEDVASSPVMY